MARIGVIGTAGRKGPPITRELYVRMFRHLQGLVAPLPEPLLIQSGGAAVSDHLAVLLFLSRRRGAERDRTELDLYLPCRWDASARRFAETGARGDPGGIMNFYHRRFWAAVGADPFADLEDALALGAVIRQDSGGFRDRNAGVARGVDYLVAYTWGQGDEPEDGGTAHTWGLSKVLSPDAVRVHVPLSDLKGA